MLGAHGDVMLELFADLGLHVVAAAEAANQRPDPGAQPFESVWAGHAQISCGVAASDMATASVRRRQLALCSPNWRRPNGVSW